MAHHLVVYGHNYCPQVHTIRAALEKAGVNYEYIDIRKDDAARLKVKEINSGYESVPTLVFTDGSTLTEPSEEALFMFLETAGIQVEPLSRRQWALIYLGHPFISALGLGIVLGGGIFTSLEMVVVGSLVLLIPLVMRLLQR